MESNNYLFTLQTIKDIEKEHIEKTNNSFELMELAAKKAVDTMLEIEKKQNHWAILAGVGNNGGDGYMIAYYLHQKEKKPFILTAPDTQPQTQEALHAYRLCKEANIPFLPPSLSVIMDNHCSVVDAVFGIGFKNELPLIWKNLFQEINAQNATQCFRVFAIDIPSGLEEHEPPSGPILKADHTMSFIDKKTCLHTAIGRKYSGQCHYFDLGIKHDKKSHIHLNAPSLWKKYWPSVTQDMHKYSRGVALIYGNHAMPGAAILAVGAARRIGAGLVKIATQKGYEDIFTFHHPGAIVESFYDSSAFSSMLELDHNMAFLIGPGAGINIGLRNRIFEACRKQIPIILDADALRVIAYDIDSFAETQEKIHDFLPVLTPHEGEFIDLFGDDIANMQKLDGTLAAALKAKAIIVRKGSSTIIASPQGDVVMNDQDSPYLATAGSGDVLSGMITGLIAQKMPSFHAACSAVYIQGLIGKKIGPGLIAEDIINHIAAYYGNTIDEYIA